ncbi:MAG: PBS lyase, partial [Calothrix sp. SM1_7_51]|nr:PBS lyase [Calothrix sp. SM1_7_51]
MMKIEQLLVQAQIARNAGDWSLLTQYLILMIASIDFEDSDVAVNQEQVLDFALTVLEFWRFSVTLNITKVFHRLGDIAINPLVEIIESDETEEELRAYAG